MRVVDCVLYSCEEDLLRLRLRECAGRIGRLVVVEGEATFTGHPRELRFPAIEQEVRAMVPDLVYVRVPKVETANPWEAETAHRNAMLRGLDGIPDDAVVLMSDADELWAPWSMEYVVDSLAKASTGVYLVPTYYYYLNGRRLEADLCTRYAKAKTVREMTPQAIRKVPQKDAATLESCGWHFSYLGGGDAIRRKIAGFSHQECNTPDILAAVDANVAAGRDLFGRKTPMRYERASASYPTELQRHPERYAQHLWGGVEFWEGRGNG